MRPPASIARLPANRRLPDLERHGIQGNRFLDLAVGVRQPARVSPEFGPRACCTWCWFVNAAGIWMLLQAGSSTIALVLNGLCQGCV
jgi:hypothetical protein